jgi:hypothetical protein
MTIEKELLERLRKGVYAGQMQESALNDGIVNVDQERFGKALDRIEEEMEMEMEGEYDLDEDEEEEEDLEGGEFEYEDEDEDETVCIFSLLYFPSILLSSKEHPLTKIYSLIVNSFQTFQTTIFLIMRTATMKI